MTVTLKGLSDDVSVASTIGRTALADLRRWRIRAIALLCLTGAAIALLVGSCHADRRHAADDAARERHIDNLTAFAAHAKAEAAIQRRENNVATRVAQKHAAAYHAERAGVTIDYTAGTIAPITALGALGAPAVTPQAVPRIALALIAKCDTTTTTLELALAGARALASTEQHRADSLETASALKDQRPGPRRCGAKCGATIAIVIREAVPRVIDWLVPHRRPLSLSAAPITR